MKKTLFFAVLFLLMGLGVNAQTQVQQDCDEVVGAFYNYKADVFDVLPAEKYQYICAMSQVAFSIVEELPSDAVVVSITELVDSKVEAKVNSTYTVVDLCNYFRFNYQSLQFQYGHEHALFFAIPNSSQYLRLKDYSSIRTDALSATQQ